jgi:hypothetical protein
VAGLSRRTGVLWLRCRPLACLNGCPEVVEHRFPGAGLGPLPVGGGDVFAGRVVRAIRRMDVWCRPAWPGGRERLAQQWERWRWRSALRWAPYALRSSDIRTGRAESFAMSGIGRSRRGARSEVGTARWLWLPRAVDSQDHTRCIELA